MTTYGIIKFLHVVSVAFWLGGITLSTFFLRDAMMEKQIDQMNHTFERVQHWNLVMFVPASFVVLLTGITMLMQLDGSKTFWVLVKERFGSLFIILFIAFVVFYGRSALAKMRIKSSENGINFRILKYYTIFLNISIICMAFLIFVVTVK
ncbi:MAG: DUF2269 family protein [Thermoactinomyces sp.]